jgi:hypothetical protein
MEPFLTAIKEAMQASSTVHDAEPYKVPMNHTFTSIYVFLHHFSILGVVIMTIYIFENHPPFRTMERRNFDEDNFIFIMCIIFFLGIATWRKNDTYMKDKYAASSESMGNDNKSNGGTASSKGKSSSSANSSRNSSGSYEDINLQKGTTSRRRVTSGNSIGSNDLTSLLEHDYPIASEKSDEESSMVSSSIRRGKIEDDLMDDELLDDIITNGNQVQAKQSKELFDHHMTNVPTLSTDPDNDILNIHQTLELKGILTLCFLIYQSTNAGKAHEVHDHGVGHNLEDQRDLFNPFYNLSRIGSSAFLFMTGFGHTMYFHGQDDYSIRRLLKVLFRINFVAVLLCFALDKPYIFYTPCSVHSYFFSYVYGTMKWRSRKNYTKFGLRLKMIVTALTLYLVWDCNLGLWQIHAILFGRSMHPIAGAPYGQLWEFYFQGHLHHWAAIVGMLYAFNHGVTSLTMRRLERLGNTVEAMFKTLICFTITISLVTWAIGPFHTTKYLYNATNAYFAFLPVLWYVFMRNATQYLRSYHCELFKIIGQHSLEIYLMHHHLFISNESGEKLMILPGYPACNLVVSLGILISASRTLKSATSVLSSMLLDKSSDKKAVWSSLALFGCLGALHSLSVILEVLNMSNSRMVATVTIVCGMLLYQATMDMASARGSSKYRSKQGRKQDIIFSEDPSLGRAAPPVFGTASIVMICLAWIMAARRGVSSSVTPLPPLCGTVANDGNWTRIDGCSDYHKTTNWHGTHARISQNVCEEVHQWGWTSNKHSPHCRFRFHEPTEAQTKLRRKNVVFMGDTVTRSVYFAFCRALGDSTAGFYNAELPLHSEITKTYGDTNISFQWAPLTSDIADKLKVVKPETDLVIAGSGALDKLHLWATDADKSSYEITVKQLAKDLEYLKEKSAHVVWITPSAVNTKALPSEEKRTQMSETNVQEIRKMHEELGINKAAAFVLDTFTLTKEQVHKSYDGVHYPPQFYDAGAQILVNALDWLLPTKGVEFFRSNTSFKPRPGSMANPALGLMVLCCIMIGLFFFDGYLGFSYLASAVMQPSASPLPGRVALFYTSKEEQSRHSFVPQDIYNEVCKAYESRPRRRREKMSNSELSNKPRGTKSANSSTNSFRDDYSGSSRRSFGLSTITEDL